MRFNILGTFRKLTNQNLQPKEYIFEIKDCQLDELDKSDSPLMRININGQKFFAHRTRVAYVHQDLLKAVFTKEVDRIESIR